GGGVALLACAAMVGLIWQMRLPRIGFERGEVLFYLRAASPYRVPVDKVECFFIGQGPTLRPGGKSQNEQTVTVVTRLAEGAKQYHARQVKPSLGAWCDGYV